MSRTTARVPPRRGRPGRPRRRTGRPSRSAPRSRRRSTAGARRTDRAEAAHLPDGTSSRLAAARRRARNPRTRYIARDRFALRNGSERCTGYVRSRARRDHATAADPHFEATFRYVSLGARRDETTGAKRRSAASGGRRPRIRRYRSSLSMTRSSVRLAVRSSSSPTAAPRSFAQARCAAWMRRSAARPFGVKRISLARRCAGLSS